jgi:hypothetical protein
MALVQHPAGKADLVPITPRLILEAAAGAAARTSDDHGAG